MTFNDNISLVESVVIIAIAAFFTLTAMFFDSEKSLNRAEQLYFERVTQVAELQIAASNVNAQAQQLQTYQQNISGMFNTLIGLNNETINEILIKGGVRVLDAQGVQTFPPIITITDTTTGE